MLGQVSRPSVRPPLNRQIRTMAPKLKHTPIGWKKLKRVSFLETRNAQGATFIVSWKRNTREIRACFLCFLFPVFRLRPYTPSPTHCRRLADEHQRPTTDNDNSQRRRAKNSSQLHGNKTTMPLRGVCVTNQHFTRPRGRIPMANMQYRNEV
jgi:hypothetical protein